MSVIDTDLYVNGVLSARTFVPSAGSVTNTAIAALAGVSASKLEHQHQKVVAQVHGTASVDERRVIHRVRGATATLVGFQAGCVVANVGAATITVDLLKNGTTVLTAPISLSSANAAYAAVAASLASTSLVQGDTLEVVIDATAGGGTLGQGLFADLCLRELAQ